MSLFKRSTINRKYPEIDNSVNFTLGEKLVEVSLGGSTFTQIQYVRDDIRKVAESMPERDEYDLEEQLKAGVTPTVIKFRGSLGNVPYDYTDDVNKLYSFVSEQNVKNDVVSPENN